MIFADLFLWSSGWPWLLILPVLWQVLRRLEKRRHQRLEAILGGRVGILSWSLDPRRRRLRNRIWLVAFGALFVAMLEPAWGEKNESFKVPGLDLVFCLDLSRSMWATDVVPNRLERLKVDLDEVATGRRGDRLALVGFAGSAHLLSPLTDDMPSYQSILAEAEPSQTKLGGTNLGAALTRALAALPKDSENSATIVLLSDGEDHGSAARAAAIRCRERGIALFCGGVGSAQGSKIPVPAEDGRSESFLLDSKGEEVLTQLDSHSLEELAVISGGRYFAIAEESLGDFLAKERDQMARRKHDRLGVSGRKNRYQWPLTLTFLFLLFVITTTDRRVS